MRNFGGPPEPVQPRSAAAPAGRSTAAGRQAGTGMALQLVLGACFGEGQALPGDGAELVLAVVVSAFLGACGACRTVLEESGGQGPGEGTEYGNDRRPYGHQALGPLGWSVSVGVVVRACRLPARRDGTQQQDRA